MLYTMPCSEDSTTDSTTTTLTDPFTDGGHTTDHPGTENAMDVDQQEDQMESDTDSTTSTSLPTSFLSGIRTLEQRRVSASVLSTPQTSLNLSLLDGERATAIPKRRVLKKLSQLDDDDCISTPTKINRSTAPLQPIFARSNSLLSLMHEKGTLLGKHPQTPSPCEERSTRTKGFKSLSSGMKGGSERAFFTLRGMSMRGIFLKTNFERLDGYRPGPSEGSNRPIEALGLSQSDTSGSESTTPSFSPIAPFSPILPPNFGTPPGTPSRADSFDLFTSVPQSPIASPFGLGRSDDNPFLGSTSRRPRFEMDYLSESQWYSDYPHHLTKEYLEELFNLDKRVMFTETKSGSRNYPDYLKSNFYVSETLLGKGDFADVLKVQNKHNKEFYAVKRLVRTVQGAMERKRYLNEVRNMWRVEKCPNVLQLLEAWEQRGKIYMKMELCRLGSLKSALLAQKKYGGFNERRAWRCLADLASGLRAIHDSNIIHLDIKPENVFITAAGSLKIGDFGLSITYPVETKDVTEGDKYYMAQELLNGECGKHSDIFSLGMTLYEMVTNQVDDLPGEGRLWHRLRDGDFDMKEYMTEDIVSLPPSSSDDTSGKDQQAATSTSLPAATGTTPHTTIKIFGYHKLFSKELLDLIKKMMQPTYEQRPTAAAILKTPRVHEILAKHSENGSKGVRTDEAMSGLLLQSI